MSKNWKTPRESIATVFKDNDYGYAFHGGMLFVEFLTASKLSAAKLKGQKILDYGCGTGRVSRYLALTGAHVIGYDPTSECIAEGLVVESKKVPPTSLTPKLLTSDLSQIGNNFDYAICINVLDHLTNDDYMQAVSNITDSLREGGTAFLWVHKRTPLPLVDTELVRSNPTNTVIIKGTKVNGQIEYFQKC